MILVWFKVILNSTRVLFPTLVTLASFVRVALTSTMSTSNLLVTSVLFSLDVTYTTFVVALVAIVFAIIQNVSTSPAFNLSIVQLTN